MLGRFKSYLPSLGPGTLYRSATEGDRDVQLPFVEVELSTFDDSLILPVELIPALDPIDRFSDVAGIVGFGAAVHRIPCMEGPPNIDRSAAIDRAHFFWNYSLRGARGERTWMGTRFQLAETPWPTKSDTEADIAAAIVNKLRPDFAPVRPAVEHLSCHFKRSEPAGSDDDTVILKARGMFAKEIKLKARTLSTTGAGRVARSGLVFLNGCGSQPVNARAVSPVARVLFQLGRDAIVTTWSDVPDDVARIVSGYFYESFLGGDTVGVALWKARSRLLLEWNNPLGLLYTALGNSQLTLNGIM